MHSTSAILHRFGHRWALSRRERAERRRAFLRVVGLRRRARPLLSRAARGESGRRFFSPQLADRHYVRARDNGPEFVAPGERKRGFTFDRENACYLYGATTYFSSPVSQTL